MVQRTGEYGLDSRQMDSVCYLKGGRGLGGDGKVGTNLRGWVNIVKPQCTKFSELIKSSF